MSKISNETAYIFYSVIISNKLDLRLPRSLNIWSVVLCKDWDQLHKPPTALMTDKLQLMCSINPSQGAMYNIFVPLIPAAFWNFFTS